MEVLPQIKLIVAIDPLNESFSLFRHVLEKNKVDGNFPKLWNDEVYTVDDETTTKNKF